MKTLLTLVLTTALAASCASAPRRLSDESCAEARQAWTSHAINWSVEHPGEPEPHDFGYRAGLLLDDYCVVSADGTVRAK